ncbi:MAG: DUF1553 domain-containing protein, partial [Caldilineaceae bacterium]|nr:DUF1553 domain-containing protein [Caldilineaceae bacterium]
GSDRRPDAETFDPENRLLARMSRRRLDFEAFRDALLMFSGGLDASEVGRASVDITAAPYPHQRTVYARVDRQNLPGVFRTFDFAGPDSHSPKRFETTVPQQALYQMNHPFVMERAEAVADSVYRNDGEHTPDGQVRRMFARILQRPATEDEVAAGVEFLRTSGSLVPDQSTDIGWQYGWAQLSDDLSQLANFQPFPRYHDGRWGGSDKLPDEKLGWCMLNRDGGHTGHGLQFCPVRRWVADRDSVISIRSTLKHSTDQGDGVRGHVLVNGRSQTSVAAYNNQQEVNVPAVVVRGGDTVDFTVDCRSNESHDSFHWVINMTQSVNEQPVRQWRSDREFSDKAGDGRLSPLAQLAQALMLTNEFLFVD